MSHEYPKTPKVFCVNVIGVRNMTVEMDSAHPSVLANISHALFSQIKKLL